MYNDDELKREQEGTDNVVPDNFQSESQDRVEIYEEDRTEETPEQTGFVFAHTESSQEAVADTVEHNEAGYVQPVQVSTIQMDAIPDNLKDARKDEKKRQKKERQASGKKPRGLGFKVVTFSISAVLLGGLAGAACYAVSYAGFFMFPVTVDSKTGSSTAGSQVSATISDSDVNVSVYDVSDMVSNVITSVVAIDGTETSTVNNGFFGNQSVEATVSGSGIIIGKNDTELLIVTNAHVVDGVDNLAVSLYDGSKVDASVKGIKSTSDLAVLAIKLSDIPSSAVYTIATLGDSSDLKVGEAAIAVGNSMGYGISVTTGVISALDKTVTVENVDYEHLIQTDAAINPGNSGGALFNANGEVIGINSVKMTDTDVEGMGYAISISSVKDIISDLSTQETKEKYSDSERGYLGITGMSITSDISETYGYPVGVLVRTVSDDSAAANAGIKKNDVITSFDGETVSTIDELVDMMSYYKKGESVEVVYYHMNSDGEYEKQTTTVTLSAKPAE